MNWRNIGLKGVSRAGGKVSPAKISGVRLQWEWRGNLTSSAEGDVSTPCRNAEILGKYWTTSMPQQDIQISVFGIEGPDYCQTR